MKEKLEDLFEEIILGREINREVLTLCGINSQQINALIASGLLKRVKHGQYNINRIDEFYAYCKKNYKGKNKAKWTKCLEICASIDGSFEARVHATFTKRVQEENYGSAIKYLNILLTVNNPEHRGNLLFCLCMLNAITTLPEEYQRQAASVKLEDTLTNLQNMNEREKALHYHVKSTFFLSIFKSTVPTTFIENFGRDASAITHLLNRLSKMYQSFCANIHNLASEKRFKEIRDTLTDEKNRYLLSPRNEIMLELTKSIIDIIETRRIPERLANTDPQPEQLDYYAAIQNKDYKQALSIVRPYGRHETLKLLLTEMCIQIEFTQILNENAEKEPEARIESYFEAFYRAVEENKSDLANYILGAIRELSRDNAQIRENIIDRLRSAEKTLIAKPNQVDQNTNTNTQDAAKISTNFERKSRSFSNDLDDYYGIKNFKLLADYIQESKLDVDTACRQFGLDDESIEIVKLIYAREFYSQGEYQKGDEFILAVEKNKDKTQKVRSLIHDIRKNKFFYINRTRKSETKIHLNYRLRPIGNKS